MSVDERPDLDTLADYLEGLLDENERARVERWIEQDPRTAQLVRELDELPSLLADVPAEPMPTDVASRVDAALAAEATRVAKQVTPVTLLAARRRRWLAPALVAAAAVGAIGIGGQVIDTVDLGGGGEAAMPAAEDEGVASKARPDTDSGETPRDGVDLEPEEGYEDPDSAPEQALTSRVSSTTFSADVVRVVRERRLRGDSSVREGLSGWSALRNSYSIVDDDCGADLGTGLFAPIRLDGEPALLVLRRVAGQPRQREAVAYPAQCPAALVDSEPMDLPALARATITLP